ncbi:alpha/beta hydrolase [Herbiconiux sp. CPCC 203407]|uniref:Alpha/beta hydrolase n=1 Tax=Herbiconiux oxytropis TaxID=2970915 RepID=A0AA41XHQ7_9MICO|nr:alpha/beta hydrolase [Herbiconiux oxytropis]MCS5722569.1 alpha/beta hydrolase [Herbiconiux oxytropis]MCS5726509.1 alpha/beta hydrolase [Herbiconiux oxytropis]
MSDIEGVIALLRSAPVDFTADLASLRARFATLADTDRPRPPATVRSATTAGVPVLEITHPDDAPGVVIFVHAGGYIAGSAEASLPLAARIARAAGRRLISVDYALAPEHPFPVARDQLAAVYDAVIDEGVRPAEIALVGASAGGGIALQFLVATTAPPPGALVVLSPFADLELLGESMERNASDDPSLTRSGLERCAGDYLGATPAVEADVLHASLEHFPPTLIQVGALEILQDDSVRLAAVLARAGVEVRLQSWAGMVHVFPTFAGALAEGREAIEGIGAFITRYARQPG